MQKITLYRYSRLDGGIDVSPIEPVGVPYTNLWRLVADEGMELVKGNVHTTCVDTDEDTGWTEEPEQVGVEEDEQDINA